MPIQIAPGVTVGIPTISSFTPTSGNQGNGRGRPDFPSELGTTITVTGQYLHAIFGVQFRCRNTAGNNVWGAAYAAMPRDFVMLAPAGAEPDDVHWGLLSRPTPGSLNWGTQITFTIPAPAVEFGCASLITGQFRVLGPNGTGTSSGQLTINNPL